MKPGTRRITCPLCRKAYFLGAGEGERLTPAIQFLLEQAQRWMDDEIVSAVRHVREQQIERVLQNLRESSAVVGDETIEACRREALEVLDRQLKGATA